MAVNAEAGVVSRFVREALWLTRWQLHQAQTLIQWGLVCCNSAEAELRNIENQAQDVDASEP